MGKVRYYYNPESCDYEQIKPLKRRKVLFVLLYTLSTLLIAYTGIKVYESNFPSWKEAQLTSINTNLEVKWRLLEEEVVHLNTLIEVLWVHDEEIRKILELDSLPMQIRTAGIGGSPNYTQLKSEIKYYKEQISLAYDRISKIKAKLQVQNASFDTLLLYAKKRDLFWAAMPAIQPVENKNLRRISTVYGMRLNPVLKRWMPHKGFDFMGSTGVPIIATGDGTIVLSNMTSGGFGNQVVINHGYGYKTRYAHLNTFTKKRGDVVKRGEIIGYMGNSGRSAGTHLHYEVLKNGVQVNPIGFFEMELGETDLATILENASKNKIVLD